MSRIIEVNQQFSYAVVEPSVIFTDLYQYCASKKLQVWPSVPSLGWVSVVGSVTELLYLLTQIMLTSLQTVDRGTGFTPTATHHQNIAGLEVMLADGDLVRTGQFAISNSPSAHLSKFSFGPSMEGLFLQSNLRVVTKMGIWLQPQPQAYMSWSFDMPEFEDVETIVDIFGELRRDGLLPSTVYVSNIVEWLGMVEKRSELWPNESPIPDWRLRKLEQQLNLGYWNVKFGLYGTSAVIQAQFKELKRIISKKATTAVHRLQSHIFSGENDALLKATSAPDPHGGLFVGIPSLWGLPMVKYRLPTQQAGVGAPSENVAIAY